MNDIQLHDYQRRMALFAILHQNCILSVDMGLGKTLTMLHMLTILQPKKCYIIAPKRVAENTWADEVAKWGMSLDIVSVKGTKNQRLKLLEQPHSIYVLSRENLADIQNEECEVLILDELTSFKNIDSQRTKYVLTIKAHRRIGLTGTFLANGAIDIYAQCAACGIGWDGLNFYAWRGKYFVDVLANAGVVFSKWALRGSMDELLEPIKDSIFTLTKDDWLTIPETTYTQRAIKLSDEEFKEIQELDSFLATKLQNGDIVSVDEKSKFVKLQTLCNGFVYSPDGEPIYRGDSTKLRAVCDYVIDMHDRGEHVLLFYSYIYEVEIITNYLRKAHLNVVNIKDKNAIYKWNNGEIDVLLAHPASAGHGLNLQAGGRIVVWSTLTYNYELFAQANARLARQGQNYRTFIEIFIAEGTCEERILKALRDKQKQQDDFLNLTKFTQ